MSDAAHRWWTRIVLASAAVGAAGVGGYWVRSSLGPSASQWPSPAAEVPVSAIPRGRSPLRSSSIAASRSAGHSRRGVPDTLPDIAFPDRRGTLRHFSHWKGRPLLVNFWAPWCGPCREEVPLLERLSRAPADHLQVIGVAVDSKAPVLRYARNAGIRYPVLIGEQRGLKTIRALGLQPAFPFSVFVDARGRIVTVKIGILREPVARLILKRIDALDSGQIDLATAQAQIEAGVQRLAVARAEAGT